jgi:hypothetical protein
VSREFSEREALRRELPFIESFSLADLLRAFGREDINDVEQTASFAMDHDGRSVAHQVAALDLLAAWCAYQQVGNEDLIANPDAMRTVLPDDSVIDFSGNKTFAILFKGMRSLCDRFGWTGPALPNLSRQLTDVIAMYSNVEAIREWAIGKLRELEASGANGPDEQKHLAKNSRGPELQESGASKERKRSTESGEAERKLISALLAHHHYSNGGCDNFEPIGNNEIAGPEMAGVVKSTASNFFKKYFGGHSAYKKKCLRPSELAFALKLMAGDVLPKHLDVDPRRDAREGDDE